MERDYARRHMEKYGLKPCPHCGGNAYLEKKQRAFINGQTCLVAFVRCVECNARSGRYKLSDYGCKATSAEAVHAAVDAWNRRRPPCEEAEKTNSGCLGFGKGPSDDEPTEVCKNCPKYVSYGIE